MVYCVISNTCPSMYCLRGQRLPLRLSGGSTRVLVLPGVNVLPCARLSAGLTRLLKARHEREREVKKKMEIFADVYLSFDISMSYICFISAVAGSTGVACTSAAVNPSPCAIATPCGSAGHSSVGDSFDEFGERSIRATSLQTPSGVGRHAHVWRKSRACLGEQDVRRTSPTQSESGVPVF